jgi:hypothetical protein
LAKEKRSAYTEYRRVQTNEAYENYKRARNRINSSIRKIKEQYQKKLSTEGKMTFMAFRNKSGER